MSFFIAIITSINKWMMNSHLRVRIKNILIYIYGRIQILFETKNP
jgi:hypothetical protein